jgi:hypothetical protein
MSIDINALHERLRGLPFRTGHPILCQHIADIAAAEFAHRVRAIRQAQIRIRLTASFRTAIYPNPDAGAAAQQILRDFHLCAVFGSHAFSTESLAHEFDHSPDKDAIQQARKEALQEVNHLSGEMAEQINATLSPGSTGTVDELPALKMPPERTPDPAAEFHKTTENLLLTLSGLAELISTSGQLGALYHTYCNAVDFPDNAELTATARAIGENGETIVNEAREAAAFVQEEITRIKSAPSRQP